jgi:hypothetical protein
MENGEWRIKDAGVSPLSILHPPFLIKMDYK